MNLLLVAAGLLLRLALPSPCLSQRVPVARDFSFLHFVPAVYAPTPPNADVIPLPPPPPDSPDPEPHPPPPPIKPPPPPPPPPPPVPTPSSQFQIDVQPVAITKDTAFFPATLEEDVGQVPLASPPAPETVVALAPTPRHDRRGAALRPFRVYGPPSARSQADALLEFSETSSDWGTPTSLGGSGAADDSLAEFNQVSSDWGEPARMDGGLLAHGGNRLVFSHLVGEPLFAGPNRLLPSDLRTSPDARLLSGSFSFVSPEGTPVDVQRIGVQHHRQGPGE